MLLGDLQSKKETNKKNYILSFFSRSLATPTTSASLLSFPTPGSSRECEEEADDPGVSDETPESEIFELQILYSFFYFSILCYKCYYVLNIIVLY